MAVFRMPPLAPRPVITAPIKDFETGSTDAGVSVSATGLGVLEQRLLAMPKVFRDAAGREMEIIASEVIADAQENYVPWLTERLKYSGRWDEYDPNTNATITKIAMWFGGVMEAGVGSTAAAGALTVMPEGLDRSIAGILNHRRGSSAAVRDVIHGRGGEEDSANTFREVPPSVYAAEQHENLEYRHPRGGGPKYLEIPFLKKYPEILPRLANAAGVGMEMMLAGGWARPRDPGSIALG